MASGRLPHLRANTQRARDMVGLGQSISSMTGGTVDGSDLFRSALVQAVAALDAYVHGVILDKTVDLLMGRSAVTGAARVTLNANEIADLLAEPAGVQQELLARALVAQRLARDTFQKPDDIAKAYAGVGVRALWTTAFPSTSQQVTADLRSAVTRRNDIVHACDSDPLTPGAVNRIDGADVLPVISTIESIGIQLDFLV